MTCTLYVRVLNDESLFDIHNAVPHPTLKSQMKQSVSLAAQSPEIDLIIPGEEKSPLQEDPQEGVLTTSLRSNDLSHAMLRAKVNYLVVDGERLFMGGECGLKVPLNSVSILASSLPLGKDSMARITLCFKGNFFRSFPDVFQPPTLTEFYGAEVLDVGAQLPATPYIRIPESVVDFGSIIPHAQFKGRPWAETYELKTLENFKGFPFIVGEELDVEELELTNQTIDDCLAKLRASQAPQAKFEAKNPSATASSLMLVAAKSSEHFQHEKLNQEESFLAQQLKGSVGQKKPAHLAHEQNSTSTSAAAAAAAAAAANLSSYNSPLRKIPEPKAVLLDTRCFADKEQKKPSFSAELESRKRAAQDDLDLGFGKYCKEIPSVPSAFSPNFKEDMDDKPAVEALSPSKKTRKAIMKEVSEKNLEKFLDLMEAAIRKNPDPAFDCTVRQFIKHPRPIPAHQYTEEVVEGQVKFYRGLFRQAFERGSRNIDQPFGSFLFQND